MAKRDKQHLDGEGIKKYDRMRQYLDLIYLYGCFDAKTLARINARKTTAPPPTGIAELCNLRIASGLSTSRIFNAIRRKSSQPRRAERTAKTTEIRRGGINCIGFNASND